MKFNERLVAARKHAGLTQQQLIEKLPTKNDGKPMMSQANLAKMEKNPNTIGSNNSYYIAKVCNVNIEWLISGEGQMTNNMNKNYENSPEAKVLKAMEHMNEATKYQLLKISNTLAEPAEPNNKHDTQ